MTYTPEERRKAQEQICNGGKDAGIAFFSRHPHLGFAVAEELQCESNVLREALQAMYDAAKAVLAQTSPKEPTRD